LGQSNRTSPELSIAVMALYEPLVVLEQPPHDGQGHIAAEQLVQRIDLG
jgi:hypothetical protein